MTRMDLDVPQKEEPVTDETAIEPAGEDRGVLSQDGIDKTDTSSNIILISSSS